MAARLKLIGKAAGGLWTVAALGCLLTAFTPIEAQQAEKVEITLDPATTEIHYTLKDTLHTVHGSFKLKSGGVTVNTKTGEATGMIVVDVASGESGNSTRDGKMKREFLETVKFPLATFQPQTVTGLSATGASQTITVAGIFTLHGDAHPLTLKLDVTLDGTRAMAATQFKIPYVAWGIKDPSVAFLKVEKEVTMDVVAKGVVQAK